MLNVKLNIAESLKDIMIIALIFLHSFGYLILEHNNFKRFNDSKVRESIINNNNDLQSDTVFVKKDNRDLQTFITGIEKQKSRFCQEHHFNNVLNLLLTYFNEESEFCYQKVDNKILNPRSPPVCIS